MLTGIVPVERRQIMKKRNRTDKTTKPVEPGNFTGVLPEFGRAADLQKHFGIRRGTAYNLLAAGKIRGVLLRVKGRKSGCRLFDMGSVRDLTFWNYRVRALMITPRTRKL